MKIVSFIFLVLGLLCTTACGGGGGGSGGNATATGGTNSGGGAPSTGTGGGGAGGGGVQIVGGLVPGGASLRIDTNVIDVRLDVASGGTGANVDFGDVDALGSIVINDKTINTDVAVVRVEGAVAALPDIRQGQAVLVISDATGLSATGVHYRANVKGPATSVTVIDPLLASAELVVFGQTVRTAAATVFAGTDLFSMSAGDLLEISGTLNADGSIQATYVELESALSEYKVVGAASAVSAAEFSIGGLTVDATSANVIGLPAGIVTGDLVEVRGAVSGFGAPDRFVADEIEALPRLEVGDAVPVDADGIVNAVGSSSEFEVQTLPVRVDAQTAFENGDPDDVELGIKLKVRGTLGGDGVLLADSVTIQPTNAVRAEGPLEAINGAGDAISVLGVLFELRSLSRLEDDSAAGVEPLSPGDLGLGDEVEVRGYLDGGVVVVSRLEREDPEDDARLRGPITALDAGAGTLSILSTAITVQDGLTSYEDENDGVLTRAEFFARVRVGDFVAADWDVFSDTGQPVDQLSLEED